MRNFFIFIWEVIKIVVVAALIVLPIRYFLFQPFIVKGQSMEPNFGQGDYLIIDQLSFRLRPPQRGEVVVFRYPRNPSQRYIKRIIGLPGEEVRIGDGKVKIDGKILDETEYISPETEIEGVFQSKLSENGYFVLGDNRYASSDSRRWGPLPKENIVGRVFLRLWPFAAFAKFEAPIY